MSYCIIHRENKHSECFGLYDSCDKAVFACKRFVESTGLRLTDEEFNNLFCLQETNFELPGSIGEYSLQIVWMQSLLMEKFSFTGEERWL